MCYRRRTCVRIVLRFPWRVKCCLLSCLLARYCAVDSVDPYSGLLTTCCVSAVSSQIYLVGCFAVIVSTWWESWRIALV